tara:strand:+ start:491 stop:919 length:429 start_codon:yes stop_codon:yes gene_type:complete
MLKDEVMPSIHEERARLQQKAGRIVSECWSELTKQSSGRFITYTVVLRNSDNELRINWAKQWAQPGAKAGRYSKKVVPLSVRKRPYYIRRDMEKCPDWIWEIVERYEDKFKLLRSQNKMLGEFAQHLAGYEKLCTMEQATYG